ncbi:MAG TPA: antitoxin Xre/MbcA/ParS toxin-binding domain-containing protein [Chitinophaga sp.]|uniref:type II RES/Xre toxin-antitoxin system antitoxin n=1 Tax=Chitinophaga sp. TaxID=1869181 RepID=UPI002F929146
MRTGNVLAKYEPSFDNDITLLLSAKKGLKPEAVFDFITISQFSANLVEQLLNKTIKTFTKYKEQNTPLDATVSEKLLKLFALYDKGTMVFGNVNEFNKWMALPSFGLGNQVPLELLDTITGIELIAEELTRIAYGDIA